MKTENYWEKTRLERRRRFSVIEIPPIDGSLSKFLDAASLVSKNVENIILQMKSQHRNLLSLLQENIRLADFERKLLNSYHKKRLDPIPFLVHHLTFARNKYFNYFLKMHRYKNDKYAVNTGIISQMAVFLDKCVHQVAPVYFKYDKFVEFIDINNDPKYKKMNFKFQALYSYIRSSRNRTQLEIVTADMLYTELQQTAELVDPTLLYISPNPFDDIFYVYTMRSGLIGKFQQLLMTMPQIGSIHDLKEKKDEKSQRHQIEMLNQSDDIEKTLLNGNNLEMDYDDSAHTSPIFNENLLEPCPDEMSEVSQVSTVSTFLSEDIMEAPVNFNDFDTFVQFFFISLGKGAAVDKNSFIVMRCAAIRFLFDLYYIENSAVLYGSPCSHKYINQCKQILEQTPKSMEISNTIFGEPLCNEPMRAIMLGNSSFFEASEILYMCQFLVNPLDISASIYDVMKILERSAKVFAMIQLGDDANSDAFDLSFDDIFSLLVPTFAFMPFICPNATSRFLNLFQNLKISQTLDYAKVSLCAVIDHIKENANA
ncbi:hypothetical protein TRFO_03485 [Tritrichomonas foetus]|uniref:VPS9 domain-containing protein n=1 Tax=Tritrichomonas foetus TaxID=1144522 RepID=A0A1J4KU90_9EUKA|nr:hypothetical protein TRFO_03485 [Tritrichomonas foetus]|eukprot:OHT13061.1 hypothetical protein TRFO_03485 [Tritrichomonas foetus]